MHSVARIIGWLIDTVANSNLVVNALDMPNQGNRNPFSGGVVHADHGAQPEFNRSSQHLEIKVVSDGYWKASTRGPCDAWSDEISGFAGSRTRYSGEILEGNRQRPDI
jgi:hypothetical protein